MKKLRKLASVVLLALTLGLPAFAGEMQTPPCTPPQPGELQTPPCQGSALGETSSPSSLSTATTEEQFTEVATEVLESLLSIF